MNRYDAILITIGIGLFAGLVYAVVGAVRYRIGCWQRERMTPAERRALIDGRPLGFEVIRAPDSTRPPSP